MLKALAFLQQCTRKAGLCTDFIGHMTFHCSPNFAKSSSILKHRSFLSPMLAVLYIGIYPLFTFCSHSVSLLLKSPACFIFYVFDHNEKDVLHC